MLAGALEIQLTTGIAELVSGLGLANRQIGAFSRDASRSLSGVEDAAKLAKEALGLIGVGVSVGWLVEFVSHSIEATSHMKELGAQAGVTAEAISRFELPARAAGSSLEAVAVGMSHMSKAIVDGQDPANRSALALKAIGLSSHDLIAMKPDEAFIAVSKALAEYSDGAEKNAVIQQILGRATGDVKAVLTEVAASGHLAATVTQEQADQAQKLTTEMTKLKIQSEEFTRGLLSNFVPGMTRIVQAMIQAREEGNAFEALWVGLGGMAKEIFNPDLTPLQKLSKELSGVNDQLDKYLKLEDQLSHASTLVQMSSNAAGIPAIIKQLQDTKTSLLAQIAALQAPHLGAAPDKPPPHFDTTSALTDAAYQRMLADATRELTTAQAQQLAGATPLTEAEKKLLAVEADPKWKDLSKQEQTNIKVLLGVAGSVEQVTQSLKDQADAQLKLNAVDAETMKQVEELMSRGKDRVQQLDDQIKQMQAENDTLGQSDLARQLVMLDLQKEVALRGVLNPQIRDDIEQRYASVKALAAEHDGLQQQLSVWNQVGDAVGNAFSSMLTQGTRAIDALRNLVKQLLADLIGLFAKRFILQLAAGAAGGAATSAGASLGGAALSAGENTLGGAALNAVGGLYTGASMIGTGATVGGVASGVFGTSALVADDVAGATFVGTGVSGAVGTAAGFLGASAETAAAIASWVPVIGWVIAVAAILYAAFGNKGGGPKVGGSSFGTFAATGAFLGNTPVPGSDNGRFYTPDQLDPQMTSYRNAVAASYYSTVARYGGHALSLDIGGGADNDPRGSAQSRVSGIVVNHATGEILYHNQDQGVDDKAVPATLTLQAQQMVIAALQHSDLPQYLANVFRGVNALTLTQDQVNALFQTADALKAVFDIASRDPLADAAKAWTDALDPFDAALRNNGLAMRSVMDAYDGSATAATNLQQATTAYYNAQVQLLNQLTSAKQAIDGMFGDTFRGFKLAGMSDQDKYNFYQSEAQGLEQKALASTDPAEIQRLVQQITQDEQAAFALLTPEQQAGAVGQNFITQGTAAQQAIDTHIDHIKDAVAEATKDTLNEIKTLIAGPTGSMNSAANTMNGAANTIADSADRPLHVIVDNPGGAQEVTG